MTPVNDALSFAGAGRVHHGVFFMADYDQQHLVNAMRHKQFYPHAVDRIEVVETHISTVFLTGPYAYKLKKPVEMTFLDFTLPEKRKYYCDREVMLNRRLAPETYISVLPISKNRGHFRLNSRESPVDYVVMMHQLPTDASMDRILSETGVIDAGRIDLLAQTLSAFLDTAKSGDDISSIGSWEAVNRNCQENFSQIASAAPEIAALQTFKDIRAAMRAFLKRNKTLFQKRMSEGKIKDGHGDLRAEHIYFSDFGIAIIDCIEFNDRFRYGDIASELAFLSMDLDILGHPEIAQDLLRQYAGFSTDTDFFSLLPFYQCYRAMVRVIVNLLRMGQKDITEKKKNDLLLRTQQFLGAAGQYAENLNAPPLTKAPASRQPADIK